MATFDLIIRNATVVTGDRAARADVGIAGEQIAAIEEDLPGDARLTIDASGLHLFPGLIDSHVHFNEPGRANWEGIETGSRALAAGGATMFFDMPLNSHPPTIDSAAFDLKLAAAQSVSLLDFGLWGGIVPGNVDQLEGLAGRGVVGFKAFMADSGIDDFPRADDRTLRAGMKKAAELNALVAVHAESETMIRARAERCLVAGAQSARDYLDSRPIEAELDAISRAIEMAGETRCALHIVHVSCGAGVAIIASARKRGVNVSCETCPHYLVLAADDVLTLGALAKCAPPLRPKPAQTALWEQLVSGAIDTIGSDHSPSPPEMKTSDNFFKIWGGISGGQHTLPLLLGEAQARTLPLPRVVGLTSANVARRFRLPSNKGRLAVGADADLALVRLDNAVDIRTEALLYRHRQSPYVGRKVYATIERTIVRGQTVWQQGRVCSEPIGRLVKPLAGQAGRD